MITGWQVKALGEVAVVFDGPHATPKTVDSGPVFLGIGALQDGVINLSETRHVTEEDYRQWTRRVRPQADDFVFSYETRLGQAAIIPPGLDCCLGRRMGLVRFSTDAVLPRFFLYQYLSPASQAFLASKTIRGATVDRISIKDFPSFPIAIPSVNEQRRIVAILDEAFEGIATAKANTEKSLQNARELFEAYLQAMFEQRTDAVSLSTCATEISDGDHAPPPKSPTGVPFITISNVDKETRRIDFGDTFTVPRHYFDALKAHRKPKKGDVLYTVTGSFGIPILIEDDSEFCFQRHIGLIRPKPGIDSRWLTYALLSPQVRAQAEAGATGTAQRTVSLGVLRGMTVPNVDAEHQRRVAARVDAFETEISRLKDIARAKLSALDELKRSLLHQTFTGAL